jgi:hypothetical protein
MTLNLMIGSLRPLLGRALSVPVAKPSFERTTQGDTAQAGPAIRRIDASTVCTADCAWVAADPRVNTK